VRLALKEKTFRKETDPTYGKELHQVEINNHNGLYMVDGILHTRKDLQLVKGQVIPTKKKSAQQVREDKIGKTAYNPELRDLTQSKLSPEKVETMIDESMKLRNKAEHTTIKLNLVLHLLKLKNGMKAGKKYKPIKGYLAIIVLYQTDPKNSSKLI